MEAQPVLGPCANDPAMCVMVDGVLLLFAPHCAVAVLLLSEAASGAPSAKDGVPACEADPWCKVFLNALEVANAPACVNPRPAFQLPAAEV